MPTYLWRCLACEQEAEIYVPMSQYDTSPEELNKCCDEPQPSRIPRVDDLTPRG